MYVPEPCKGVGQDGSVQKLQRGIVVTVYSLKKKPERMHLMALPDISILQCVRSLKDPPEISGECLCAPVYVHVCVCVCL